MARPAAAAAFLLALPGTACMESVDLGGPGATIPGLESLAVTPGHVTLAVDDIGGPPRTVAFTATGGFADGSQRDLTGAVAWEVDNDAPGSFRGRGVYATSNRAGGRVTVRARSGTVSAVAALTVVLSHSVGDSAYPPPPGAADLFTPDKPVVVADPRRSPYVLYPADETKLPINIHRILFQYDRAADNDVWRISFDSDVAHVSVVTGSDRWQPDSATWSLIARSNAGTSATLTVSAVSTAAPATVYRSGAVVLHFSSADVSGDIYYWATGEKGIMKGSLDQASPTKFCPTPPDGTCVGCHALSRDGGRLAAGFGGETLQIVDVPSRTVRLGVDRGVPMGWATFSPDGKQLLVANKGALALLDADTGSPVGPDDGRVPLPDGMLATHPDWSPLGDWIALTVAAAVKPDGKEAKLDNKDVKAGSIARMSHRSSTFGSPEVLAASSGMDDNNFFPRYSPDGAFIAYVHAAGGSRNAKTAELRLVPAAGGSPVALPRANRRVGPQDGVIDIENTMPTWAPSGDPATLWLAFSSIRRYGVVLPLGGADQLWVAAIAPDRIAAATDPSFAAFWLPLQDVTDENHAAFWTD